MSFNKYIKRRMGGSRSLMADLSKFQIKKNLNFGIKPWIIISTTPFTNRHPNDLHLNIGYHFKLNHKLTTKTSRRHHNNK